MANEVQNALMAALQQNPQATNEELAVFIRSQVNGSKCSAASVSSMKSRLKSAIALGDALPSGMPSSLTWQSLPDVNPEDTETLEEAKKRIDIRYKAMERLTMRLVKGGVPSLIISGPPGLGKSHTTNAALEWGNEQGMVYPMPMGNEEEEDLQNALDGDDADLALQIAKRRYYDVVSGSITAVGLFQALWYTRNGGVLVLDDIDEVFRDEVCLNLLKAVLDSGKTRKVSWRKEASWLEEYGIDKTFDFKGSVVFLTNIDFEAEIAKNGKMTEHFKALIDRSLYLCLTLRTKRDFMIRIRQVAEGENGMLQGHFGLTEDQVNEVLDFVTEHQDRFYNLSLRLVGQIANCMLADPEGWAEDIEATKMRTKQGG